MASVNLLFAFYRFQTNIKYRLARAKREALVNILIVYSNKIHLCQKATATRAAEKAIGLISKKKR